MLQNSDGAFLLYPQTSFAAEVKSGEILAFYIDITCNRFEALQAFLEESENLPVVDFSTVNYDGKSYYQIKLDISKSKKGKDKLLPIWKPNRFMSLDLLIGTKDFFVYEWAFSTKDEEIDRYTLHDVELFPAGTLPEDKFIIPEEYRTTFADNVEELQDALRLEGASKTEKAVKDFKNSFTRFFKSIGTFCIESPWLACIIFVAIGIILIVTMLCIR